MRLLKTKVFTKHYNGRFIQAIANVFNDGINYNLIFVDYSEVVPKGLQKGITAEEYAAFVPDLEAFAHKTNSTLYCY